MLLAVLTDMILVLPLGVLTLWWFVTLPPLVQLMTIGGRRLRVWLPIGLAVALGLIDAVPWNSRKSFLRDFRRLEPGMSVAEVQEIMAGYIVGTGWPLPDGSEGELEISGAQVYRHSTSGSFGSDWGIVSFEAGRVVRTEFSPD